MKPSLTIYEESLSEIKNTERKAFIEFYVSILHSYHKIVELGVYSSLLADQNYVHFLFKLIDFLSFHYELSQRYFDLLDLAASHLERLYQEKISALTTEEEKTAVNKERSDYLNQIAFIFWTTADKTENAMRCEVCDKMAQEYSAKADRLQNSASPAEGRMYVQKMLRLREKAIEEFHQAEDFYREICGFPETPKDDASVPLLRGRVSSERPTSSPSPT